MADGDAENTTPPIEPRPMIIRVLAAAAIVAIVVLLMWATIRAGHNINHKVRNGFDTTTSAAPVTQTRG